MEDHYSSGWPVVPPEANWSAAANFSAYDESYLFPWPQTPHSSTSTSAALLPSWSIPTQEAGQGFPSWSTLPVQESAEDKAASVSKSHSQAEKRRRDRINAQLGILRKLIPKSDKVDLSLSLFVSLSFISHQTQTNIVGCSYSSISVLN